MRLSPPPPSPPPSASRPVGAGLAAALTCPPDLLLRVVRRGPEAAIMLSAATAAAAVERHLAAYDALARRAARLQSAWASLSALSEQRSDGGGCGDGGGGDPEGASLVAAGLPLAAAAVSGAESARDALAASLLEAMGQLREVAPELARRAAINGAGHSLPFAPFVQAPQLL